MNRVALRSTPISRDVVIPEAWQRRRPGEGRDPVRGSILPIGRDSLFNWVPAFAGTTVGHQSVYFRDCGRDPESSASHRRRDGRPFSFGR